MDEIISMSYGDGGKKTSELIETLIKKNFNNEELNKLNDGAVLSSSSKIVFSSDSFVVNPLFFSGGDIGKLCICGTVNDLLMCGSIPKYISLSLIIEEGFMVSELEKILKSIKETAIKSGVEVVTGDTKVVEKGHGHGIYINTSGIGFKLENINYGRDKIKITDKVILSGSMGNHGIAILNSREKLFESNICSDCTNLNKLAEVFYKYEDKIKILRDPTRGGVATTLNEFTENMDFSIELKEADLPIDESVNAASQMLGLDPLYIANEGKILAIVSEDICYSLIKELKSLDEGINASIIGDVVDYHKGKVFLKTKFGGKRVLDKLNNSLLPRIC